MFKKSDSRQNKISTFAMSLSAQGAQMPVKIYTYISLICVEPEKSQLCLKSLFFFKIFDYDNLIRFL